ncbi:MAG TPA: alpha/beta hydrolase family protein [Pyrinomonadaceae bacterium]|nr:alpha/beta hydrolase family protein [Pyrinomonadaceae bacterium]
MKQLKSRRFLWFLLVFSAFVSPIFAQKAETKPTAANVRSLKLNSKLMAREMPYRIVLPADYEKAKDKRFGVIYLLHGLSGHFDNWTNNTKLSDYALQYNYIIVTPEGNDGWYTDSATLPNDKYESYIVKELVPEIDKNFRTLTDRKHRAIAGLSMGGYGSLKFGLKYPQMFVVAGSFSGALPAASWSVKTLGNNGWKALTDSVTSAYGEDDSQTRKDNDIYKFAKEITPEKIKELPFLYMDCGTEDFLIQPNREFEAILLEKKVPHEFRQLPGKHDWKFWDSQIQEFLQLADKLMK